MIEPQVSTGIGSLGVNRISYEFDYFSGSQIGIYIGDVWVDDVESIQYQETQTKRPIFGYGSQYFHKIADGQVLVEGTLSIPFKEADYLLVTLDRYMKITLDRYMKTATPISVPDDFQVVSIVTGKPDQPQDYRVKRENIERRLMNAAKKDLPDYQMYNDLAALSDEAFENTAEIFEDVLWKSPEADFLSRNLLPGEINQNTDDVRRADQFPPFSIYILYGDIANAAANHTIKKLINASIIGQGQVIMVGGEPIREQYRFIAQNLG